jgi:hypothetical protein
MDEGFELILQDGQRSDDEKGVLAKPRRQNKAGIDSEYRRDSRQPAVLNLCGKGSSVSTSPSPVVQNGCTPRT